MDEATVERLVTGNNRQRLLFIMELSVVGAICAFAILVWLSKVELSQDSTSYVTASENLIKTGRLFTFANSTNFINDPAVLPYMDQPPGFPFLLAPFIMVFRDPMVSVLIAQSIYLVVFYFFIYRMSQRLQFSPLLRIVSLVLFTFVRPFWIIHNYFWTETLFIGLSIGAGYFTIGLLTRPNRKKDWIILTILLTLTSLIRYTGVANIALITPFLFKWDSLYLIRRLLIHKFTLAGLTTGGALLIVLSLLANLLPNAKPGIGPLQWLGILLGATVLLIGTAGLFLLRKNWSKMLVQWQSSKEMDASPWAIFAVLAAILPLLAWISRNAYQYRVVSNWGLFEVIRIQRFAVPFQYIWNELLGLNIILRPFAAILAVSFLILPFFSIPIIGMSGIRRLAHNTLLRAAVAQFLLIWILSFVTANENIGFRYFAPVLSFLLLGMLNGLQQASQSVRPFVLRQLFFTVPLLFLITSATLPPVDLFQSLGRVNFPPERQLWQELSKLNWIKSSSFFYSDDGYGSGGFIHQIFSGRPQGILWDKTVWEDPEKISAILSRGSNPFILVTSGSSESKRFDEMISSGVLSLEKITFHDTGYVIYRLKE